MPGADDPAGVAEGPQGDFLVGEGSAVRQRERRPDLGGDLPSRADDVEDGELQQLPLRDELAGPGDTVVCRGEPDGGAFIACWMADGRVTAGMNVDVWDVTAPIQQLIRSRRQVQPARLTDPDTPLELLAG